MIVLVQLNTLNTIDTEFLFGKNSASVVTDTNFGCVMTALWWMNTQRRAQGFFKLTLKRHETLKYIF